MPSILLSCQNLSKTYASRPLFEGLSFGLFDNERTGLIGPNGAGKSTLLKILAGLETPDAGTLSLRRGLKVQYLAQTDIFADAPAGSTVREEAVRAVQNLGWEDWEIDLHVDEGLQDSGLLPDQRVDRLSGGERKRLAILSQVMCEPDLLLLDEPTNHLDLEGVLWLENFLTNLRFPFLVITHDRRFLETVCNRMIELNKRYKDGHFSSEGNYSQFIENREAYFEQEASREETTRNTVRREIEWLRRGPKARTTKQKARIDRAGLLINDLADLEFRNAQDKTAAIDFSSSERRSKSLVDLSGVHKTLGGKKLFGPLDLHLGPGDKLGLLGSNGSGKSTLLKILAGTIGPDSGKIKRADALRVVMFDQHREQLNLEWPLRKALCENGETVIYKDRPIHVTGWADRFLFTKNQLDLPLRRLSGGEQARVLIARLMLRPADLLMLDEPTNDLDIASLEVLETSMMDFTGALVLVTHDRYLLDRVSDQILSLDGRGNANFYADLDQWENSPTRDLALLNESSEDRGQERGQGATLDAARSAGSTLPPSSKAPLSKLEQKELKTLEDDIKKAEKDRDLASAALTDPTISSNAMELTSRQKAVDDAENKLVDLFQRWGELEARK